MLYTGPTVQSFCTISPDLNHSATAIYKHLEPMFEYDCSKFESVHFQSDSPSTQYRNQKMFWMMIMKIIPQFKNVKFFSWTFTEPGHGKGPIDGVGATPKRTCDSRVKYGQDVANFQQFQDCVSNIEGVLIRTVHSVTDAHLVEEANKAAIPVKGRLRSIFISCLGRNSKEICESKLLFVFFLLFTGTLKVR